MRFIRDRKYNCRNYPIEKMEQYFNGKMLPKELDLTPFTHIQDVRLFVSSHLAYLRNNNGNFIFYYYYVRLLELKEILEKLEDW